jgi:hypothetical protein
VILNQSMMMKISILTFVSYDFCCNCETFILLFTADLFSEYKSMLEEQEMNSGFYPDSDQDEDDDYDSDPPATLPKLTKQHEYKFKDLPSQLFRHLMLERKRKINT